MLNEFISYLKEQVGQPYLWGGQHTKLTPENYISVIEKKETKNGKPRGSYSDGTTYAEAAIKFCEKKFAAGAEVLYAYDCSGLGCYWLYNLMHLYSSDVNANTMMSRCSEIDAPEPPEKGWWVFRLDGSKAVHIGYMIDDEYLIEAKGRKYGVVKTKFKEDDWDCWGIPNVFEDEICNPEPQPEPDPDVPDPTPEPTSYIVRVIGNSVNVRATDEKVDDKPVGKILFTAHKGNRFNLIDVAPSGWYHVETYKGPAYISNRKDLTSLVEK